MCFVFVYIISEQCRLVETDSRAEMQGGEQKCNVFFYLIVRVDQNLK